MKWIHSLRCHRFFPLSPFEPKLSILLYLKIFTMGLQSFRACSHGGGGPQVGGGPRVPEVKEVLLSHTVF